MNLKELIRKLPKEIIYKIRFLTYKTQDRMLLRDIKLYYTSNMFLRNLFNFTNPLLNNENLS